MAGRGRGRERMACNPARNKQHLEAVTHSAVKTLTYSKQTNPALEYKKDQLTTKHGQVDLVAPDIKSTAHSPGYREPFSVHAVFSIPYTQLSHPVNCCIQMGASPTCKDNQPTTKSNSPRRRTLGNPKLLLLADQWPRACPKGNPRR